MVEREREPFQRLAFMGDIFRGVPSTQSTYGGTYQAPPSALAGIVGAGTTLAGLQQSGLLGN